jgi:rare lipoprotein A (peptidoglycan hydrolase)
MALVLCLLCGAGLADGVEGFATYYTVASCKREGTSGYLTASGACYNEQALTCALPKATARAWNMKFGQYVRVTNLDSGKRIVVRYTDTGPGKRALTRGVVVDLTPAAMVALAGPGGLKAGRVRVRVEKYV